MEMILKLSDKEVGLRFTVKTVRDLKTEKGIDVLSDEKSIQDNILDYYAGVLLFSAKAYAKKHNTGDEFTEDDAWDWIDELGLSSEKLTEVILKFNESIVKDVPVSKKKATKATAKK